MVDKVLGIGVVQKMKQLVQRGLVDHAATVDKVRVWKIQRRRTMQRVTVDHW